MYGHGVVSRWLSLQNSHSNSTYKTFSRGPLRPYVELNMVWYFLTHLKVSYSNPFYFLKVHLPWSIRFLVSTLSHLEETLYNSPEFVSSVFLLSPSQTVIPLFFHRWYSGQGKDLTSLGMSLESVRDMTQVRRKSLLILDERGADFLWSETSLSLLPDCNNLWMINGSWRKLGKRM